MTLTFYLLRLNMCLRHSGYPFSKSLYLHNPSMNCSHIWMVAFDDRYLKYAIDIVTLTFDLHLTKLMIWKELKTVHKAIMCFLFCILLNKREEPVWLAMWPRLNKQIAVKAYIPIVFDPVGHCHHGYCSQTQPFHYVTS